MGDISILTPSELVRRVQAKVVSKHRPPTYSHYDLAPPPTNPAPYALIVGAGFSYGVIPLVRQLMHETIGDYYIPDQDQSSVPRPVGALRKHAATFWAQYNAASTRRGTPTIDVDKRGLPVDPGKAYQALFSYEGARSLFANYNAKPLGRGSYLESLVQQRATARDRAEPVSDIPREEGALFVKGFLRYVVDPGCERGHGSTGRTDLNAAHSHLAAVLEAQQTGRIGPFCRTIFTTNFDTLLQNALQKVNIMYTLTDRPEHGLDRSQFQEEESAIHLVYVHGSILRHNPASSIGEVAGLSMRNELVLLEFLLSRDVITIGYSGWEDGLMAALRRCVATDHSLYWCDVHAEPTAAVAALLRARGENAAYISLGAEGADGLMGLMYRALVPDHAERDDPQ